MWKPILLLLCTVLPGALAESQILSDEEVQRRRLFDFYDRSKDVCDNGSNGNVELGPCNESRFPNCPSDRFRCYNRKPSRDFFHPDNHQPIFYIQYDRVLCFPERWGSCSSCTPGRYCLSEERCILEEQDYPCMQWY